MKPRAPSSAPPAAAERRPDALVVGSGMGGSMAARVLVEAGMDVVMIERGQQVERGVHNWARDAAFELSPYFTMESHYRLRGGDHGRKGTFQCVGGPSVFYGGVALRLREADFGRSREIVAGTGAAWPFSYQDLAPYYQLAEGLLSVAGRPVRNGREPADGAEYPHVAPPMRGPARLIRDAAREMGLHPSHLPLAIDFDGVGGGSRCVRCGTCDGYACGVGAKRDPGSAIIPDLLRRGLNLVSGTVAVRLLRRGRRVEGVVGIDRASGRRRVFRARRYILAAGALGSAHLALASGIEAASPAGEWVGRCLMRHCNGIVYGIFPRPLAGGREFHKQVAIFDHYGNGRAEPKSGMIQSIHPPPPGLTSDRLPGAMRKFADLLLDRCTGLVVIAEDEPRRENRIEICRSRTDRYGLPRATITHTYTLRDLRARRRLMRVARRVLRAAGARLAASFRIRTFSHAVGTIRMGTDPRTAPLDQWCRFRGLDNLWVTDGSCMPRSGAVNPSLTIAANALRAAHRIAGHPPPGTRPRRPARPRRQPLGAVSCPPSGA